MAKFPTTVEKSVTIHVPIAEVYAFLWDVLVASKCLPGIDSCTAVGNDVYEFILQERSTGPVSLVVRYNARFEGNGTDRIAFRGIGAAQDNTDIEGEFRLKAANAGSTRVTLKQFVAPETPVPRLLQGFLKSFVESEAADTVQGYLLNLKAELER